MSVKNVSAKEIERSWITYLKVKMAKYKIKKVGKRYMIFDTEADEFLIGYIFKTDVEAYKFMEVLFA